MPKKDDSKISFNSPAVKNNETLRTLNRLILQKALTSDASKYMRESTTDHLNKLFLSEDAWIQDFSMSFALKSTAPKDTYMISTCDMNIKWEKGEEWVDEGGNLWMSCGLDMNFTVTSGWNMEVKMFEEKLDIWNSVSDLRAEISALVPSKINLKLLDNEGRLKREDLLYREEFSRRAREVFKAWRSTWTGLRKNGSPRSISRDEGWIKDVKHGVYEVEHNIGSVYTPRIRKYAVTIPDDPTKPAWIHRKS